MMKRTREDEVEATWADISSAFALTLEIKGLPVDRCTDFNMTFTSEPAVIRNKPCDLCGDEATNRKYHVFARNNALRGQNDVYPLFVCRECYEMLADEGTVPDHYKE